MQPSQNLTTKLSVQIRRLKWQTEPLMKRIQISSLKKTSPRWLDILWLPHNVTSSKMNNVIIACQSYSNPSLALVWVHELLILLTYMKKVKFLLRMINLILIKAEFMLFQQVLMEGDHRGHKKSSLDLTAKVKINQQS